MRRKVELDYAGIGAMIRQPGVLNDLSDRAERVAERARSLAPSEPHYDEYRDSIAVSMSIGGKRPRATIGSYLSYSMAVEGAHRILGISMDAANG